MDVDIWSAVKKWSKDLFIRGLEDLFRVRCSLNSELRLPRKVSRLTDWLDMTLTVLTGPLNSRQNKMSRLKKKAPYLEL